MTHFFSNYLCAFIFLLIWVCVCYYVLSACKVSFNPSLTNQPLPSFLKDIFAGYRILNGLDLLFSTSVILSHCLCLHCFCWKVSYYLYHCPLMWCLFPLRTFQDFLFIVRCHQHQSSETDQQITTAYLWVLIGVIRLV